MKVYGTPQDEFDVINVKYFNDNIVRIVGGGLIVQKNLEINNIVINGDFSAGTNRWSNVGSLLTNFDITEQGAYIKANPGSNSGSRIQQQLINQTSVGNIIYSAAIIKPIEGNVWFGFTEGSAVVLNRITLADIYNEWKLYSNLSEIKEANHQIFINIIDTGSAYIKNILSIDLTATFGTGNEPTKEQMDELIKMTGYFDTINLNIGKFLL